MKLAGDRRTQILLYVNRGLMICLFLMGLIFIIGTIYGIFYQATHKETEQIKILEKNGGQIFTGIGTLRVPITNPQPGMVIIFVSFVYYPENRAFSEELALRIGDFRDIITDYIGSFSVIELQQMSEESIKNEFLRRFNSILRIGKIETLYFNEFMIIG